MTFAAQTNRWHTLPMTPALRIVSMTYPRRLEEQWRQSCEMLKASNACQYLKDILVEKVSRRSGGTRRFFGEAYVATQVDHVDGYYGSFQWLRSSKFVGERPFRTGPTQAFQTEYRAALQRHFPGELEHLQRNAAVIELKTGTRPSAPDLWLIGADGSHRFIEVKLPNDTVSLGQLAGLAVIGSSFRRQAVSVEVVELNPEREREFGEFLAYIGDAG